MKDINWNTDSRVVVRSCDALAIWLNAQGEVVIAQDDPFDESGPVITFPADQAQKVADRITTLVRDVAQIGGAR